MKAIKALWHLFLSAYYFLYYDDFWDLGPKCEVEWDGEKYVPKKDKDGWPYP